MLSRIAKSLFCLFLTLLLGSFSFAQYNPKPEKSNVKANQTAEEIQQNIEILKNSSNDENLSKQLAKIYTEVTNTKSREFIVLDYSQAIPYLYKLLETNKNKNVLRWTITLLGEIDRKNILPILNENLKTETDDEIIVTILHTITNAAQPFDNPEKEELLIFIPQLIKLLKTNQNKEVLMASMNAIGYLGKDAKDSVPILIDILKTSENEDILNADIRTLGRIGKDAKDAVPYLIEIIKQKNNGRLFLYNPLLVSSIESIGNIGKGSEDAIPILLKILTEKQRTHNRINDSRFKTSIEAMDVKMDIFSLTNNIEKMLDSLISDRDFSNTDLIEKTLKDNFKKPYDPDLQKLYDKIQLLQELKQKQDAENNNFKIYIEEHYILSIMVFLTILMISLWSIFILAKPIWLVSFHEYLWTNSLMANFKYVLEFPIISLVSTICLRPRTIDTWVKSN